MTANVQIYTDVDYGPVVDDSEVYGPVGQSITECILEHWLDEWRGNTGCDVNPKSCGIRNKPMCEPLYQ